METAYIERDETLGRGESLDAARRFNDRLDRAVTAGGLFNESDIERRLRQLPAEVTPETPCFWLLMARLTELTLVTAGRYADACEFAAAGDLIVNPRQIRVHFFREKPCVVIKNRRGALSDQCNTAGRLQRDFIQWFRQKAMVEIVQAPLLDFFMETLQMSRVFRAGYLAAVRERLVRIADTLAFLGSWHIVDAADLNSRLLAATPETRQFVSSHLCNFNLDLFTALGHDIRNLAAAQGDAGDFLVPPADFFKSAYSFSGSHNGV